MLGRSGVWWAALLTSAAVGLGIVAFPTLYIMPFRPQAARILQWALTARTVAPAATLASAVVAVPIALLLAAGSSRWWRRAAAVAVAAAVVGSAWFARQNPFEWKFNPLPSPSFVPADRVTFLRADDIVMAVAIRGQATAYPVRLVAYHHVVNDELGGEPIVATY
jgi:hypothetical protein